MTLPALQKSWLFSTNNRISFVSLNDTMARLLFGIKNFLVGTVGYTVKYSCDGTTGPTSANDHTDRWLSFSSCTTRGAAAGNPQSFIVLTDSNTAVQATGTLTTTANFSNGETVTTGTKTYTFQTVLTNVDGNVFIGATAAASLANLYAAITLGAGSGTAYAAATTAHPTASANAPVGLTMLVWALTGGTGGNALASTTTVTGATWTAATLTGGTAPAAKVATLSGTSTLSGTNASRLAAATINRTSGAISITFNPRTIGTNDGPDSNSLTIGYGAFADWTAAY